MSMPHSGRLAAIAALTVVSVGAGVLAVPAAAAPAPSAISATADARAADARAADARAAAPKSGSASAASPILVTGQAGWGFKASWVRYVTGLGGTVTEAGGATKGAGGVISYPVAYGSVDPAGRDADVRFSGSVTYTVPKHGIDAITLANPRVLLKDGKGTLHMDVTTALAGGAPVATKDVPFATLTASAGALAGSKINWSGITAKLTAKGAETFSNEGQPMYPVGTVLDNLAVSGTVSVPTLTVTQVSGLGAETQVTVTGTGYLPGRGVYLAQTVALPGTGFPSVFGNAAWIRKVGADGTFTTTMKITETFTPGGAPAVDCRTTACFVASFNSHDTGDWMASRSQDVARAVHFGAAEVTTQPKSRTVRSGASAVFTAAARGADSVRWERSTDRGTTWSAIPGAASGTLSVKAAEALESSRYRAVFTNVTGEVTTESATLSVSAVPSRLTSFNAAPEPVAKGEKLTVTGTLQTMGSTDDTWRPLARTSLVIESRPTGGKTWSRAATVTTGTKGTFSAKVTTTKDSDWRARYAGTADRAASVSSTDNVDVRLRTAVSGFNASPEPVRKGRTITASGTLRNLDGSWKDAASQSVTIWFKADGAKSWSRQATVRTNGKGKFSKAFTAKKDGNWRAEFVATPSRLGSVSGSDWVDVR
ncbi:HtaA domain-containing protein [Streptomyces yaizuensis]|uniref:HtaA domain-containing protein n=1 Tax=Streptomyces yaizuensis TaxID=2989713 RepID=A0ABQ5PAH2_9ACTN|nr:HtaA domain-containing protein [Streptomyces sp. YSPA8]GLF99547.1 HtaA domain-containing protein [Streptomyces sp. YSPA8]